MGGVRLRPGTSRHQDSGLAAAFGIFLAVYVGTACCFYWLMQPTVVKNGLPAYQPPPLTVLNYADLPREPSTRSNALAARAAAEPLRPVEGSVAAARAEVTPSEVRKIQRPRRVRAYRNYAPARSFGFRWF